MMNWKTIIPVAILLGGSFFIKSCQPADGKTIQVKQANVPAQQVDDEIKTKVRAIMSKMELVDKVGEMTQLSIDMISVGDPYNLKRPNELDEEKLKKVLVDFRVGSILNVGGYAYTREHWYKIMSRIQEIATKEKPTGIPVLYGIDAIHGANYTVDGTMFPQEINLAATWNPALAIRMGEVCAYEVRASAIPWNFSPVLDLGRNFLWSRFWETFGEDPILATQMGTAIIQGYQGDDISHPEKVAACMKHFLGYSFPNTGKDRTQSFMPEHHMREYFVPMFQAAIEAGTPTIMINSAEINGVPVHCNPKILKDLLRDELGFQGLAVTDWEDIKYLYTRHRVAKDYKESIKMAINAGIDMSMVPMDLEFPVLLKELVEEGEVPMSRIDEAVERILTVKMQLGLFENAFHPMERYPKFGSEEHIQASLESAEESIILLKNNNTLPLSKNARVLVTGPTANSMTMLNGAWGRTWQGNDPKQHTKGKKTILEAIKDKVGAGRVQFVEGASVDKNINTTKAAATAKNVDALIVCLGETPYTEKPGDIDELEMSAAQQDLVKAVAKTGKPVIIVLVEGRPRTMNDIEPLASAILFAGLPGDEGGRAIANILYGDVNPSAKLPFTFPRYANTLLHYDHRGTDLVKQDFSNNAFNPQWEFGHGLSYTNFEYSDLKISSEKISKSIPLEVTVAVKNTGNRAGKEVVQLFVTDKVASITPSVKRLRDFEKINLEAGESKTITFELKVEDLALVGIDNKWITEAGEFEISIKDMRATFNYGNEN